MEKKEIRKCDNCKNDAKYILAHYVHSTLWDLEGNEINTWNTGDPEEEIYLCEDCAEKEGVL